MQTERVRNAILNLIKAVDFESIGGLTPSVADETAASLARWAGEGYRIVIGQTREGLVELHLFREGEAHRVRCSGPSLEIACMRAVEEIAVNDAVMAH